MDSLRAFGPQSLAAYVGEILFKLRPLRAGYEFRARYIRMIDTAAR